jgi:hypothetical protein
LRTETRCRPDGSASVLHAPAGTARSASRRSARVCSVRAPFRARAGTGRPGRQRPIVGAGQRGEPSQRRAGSHYGADGRQGVGSETGPPPRRDHGRRLSAADRRRHPDRAAQLRQSGLRGRESWVPAVPSSTRS